jgi:hypothetical protein
MNLIIWHMDCLSGLELDGEGLVQQQQQKQQKQQEEKQQE